MSGWLSDKGWGGDLASPGPIGNVTPSTGAFTTLSATTSVTSPIVKANGSGGGVLQSNNGTACFQWGAGGGSNVTFDGGASALDNIIISTAGKGISFTGVTPPAGMTSQLLSDYEEGTWTPVVTDGTTDVSMAADAGWYVKIGKNVTIGWNAYALDVSTLNASAQLRIKTLPFTAAAKDTWATANFPYNNSGKNITQRIPANATQIYFFVSGASTIDYDNCSRTTLGGTSVSFFGSMTYFSA